ncbi:MAG: acyl-CoA dehydrogenase family protein [Solirubrobacteraceae bacterium]
MSFAFTEDQQLLRAEARAFLEARLPLERVAQLADGDAGWDPALWREIAELGWPGVSVPEQLGGVGLGAVEEGILFEELGRACFPGPYFTTVALARDVLAGSPALLSVLAAGDCTWTVALDPDLVPDLAIADRVVLARDGALWLVHGGRREPRESLDGTRRMGRLVVDSADLELLVPPQDAEAVLAALRRHALVALSLEGVGVAQRALDLGVAHARSRVQYERMIGTFQGVAHPLAETYADLELSRSLAYWAAWALEHDPARADLAAAAANAHASRTAVAACERSIQVHGGTGFTWEFPLHRLYRRALWIDAYGGSAASRRAVVAAHVLGAAAA